MTVVGEVADAKLTSPDADASEQFYQPIQQLEKDAGAYAQPTDLNGNGGYIVLRSALPPEQMENSLRAVVRSIDAQLPLNQVQTMEQVVALSEAPRRFNTIVISSFALAAVLLAVLGIYSIIAFSVASRVQRNGHPHGAWLAAFAHHASCPLLRSQTRCHRMHARFSWRRCCLNHPPFLPLSRQPLRSGSGGPHRDHGLRFGSGRIGIARSPRRVRRSYAGSPRGVGLV
jgi:hypothetical protein